MSLAATLTQPRLHVQAALGLALAGLAAASASGVLAFTPVAHTAAPTTSSPAAQAPAAATTATAPAAAPTTTSGGSASAFGQQVRKQVATCKQQAAQAGTHGIGQCVSTWVLGHNPGHTGQHGSGGTGG